MLQSQPSELESTIVNSLKRQLNKSGVYNAPLTWVVDDSSNKESQEGCTDENAVAPSLIQLPLQQHFRLRTTTPSIILVLGELIQLTLAVQQRRGHAYQGPTEERVTWPLWTSLQRLRPRTTRSPHLLSAALLQHQQDSLAIRECRHRYVTHRSKEQRLYSHKIAAESSPSTVESSGPEARGIITMTH